MVGFEISPRLLAFWGVIFGEAVFSLTLFVAIAALMRSVSTANAIQVGASSGSVEWWVGWRGQMQCIRASAPSS